MILGHQLFGDHRVVDPLADLIADKLRHGGVGLQVRHGVAEVAEPFGETGLGPQLFVARQPFFLGHFERRARIKVVQKAGEGLPAAFENLRIGGFDLLLGLGVYRSVPERRAVIGRTLEHGHMAHILGDFGDELDRGRTGADDAHPLVAEVQGLLGPLARMETQTGEAVTARKVGSIRRGQDADGGNQKPRLRPLAGVGPDLPAVCSLVIACRGDTGAEPDVAAEVEFVGHTVEVALGLGLAGKVFAPVPLLQEFLRERIAVGITLGIETRARIAVPIPGPAHPGAGLVYPHREPQLP